VSSFYWFNVIFCLSTILILSILLSIILDLGQEIKKHYFSAGPGPVYASFELFDIKEKLMVLH
jgi:hypothetical protein